ncbi:5003_t:CDS:2, partial [Scutellospora calospora]
TQIHNHSTSAHNQLELKSIRIQIMSSSSQSSPIRQRAKDLLCLQETAKRLTLYHSFISELYNFSLSSYSICEKYYNQLISTNYFYQSLLDNPNFNHENKRSRIDSSTSKEIEFERTEKLPSSTSEEIVVSDESYLSMEFERAEALIDKIRTGNQENREYTVTLTNKILELQRQVVDQNREISEHIQEVANIALLERELLYKDINSLIKVNNRFSLKNLLNYTSQLWLSKRNPVIVKFVETLTHYNLKTDSSNNDSSNSEKVYKRAMAIDLIYRSRHGRYMLEINLVASAIKYSIARSKIIINIDNHITCSGSYSHFYNWLGELSEREETLSNGLLFMAFDNEQKG